MLPITVVARAEQKIARVTGYSLHFRWQDDAPAALRIAERAGASSAAAESGRGRAAGRAVRRAFAVFAVLAGARQGFASGGKAVRQLRWKLEFPWKSGGFTVFHVKQYLLIGLKTFSGESCRIRALAMVGDCA